ncbi:hypothetical protein NL676_030826 [Syzygium grande]|nr:hypothetical protein NL676_030826 [Syzygium grande]
MEVTAISAKDLKDANVFGKMDPPTLFAAAAAADDMECRPLEVTVISASGLKDVRDILRMNPYVVASLSGDERHSNEQRTPAHRDGGTSPRWNHALADPFTVDVAAARAGLLTLKLKIKTERTLKGDKDVGWVDVPVGDLLDQGGDGRPGR